MMTRVGSAVVLVFCVSAGLIPFCMVVCTAIWAPTERRRADARKVLVLLLRLVDRLYLLAVEHHRPAGLAGR